MNKTKISTNGHKPLIDIFWTGGWDSTFRLLSLAGKEVIIQPWYLRDNRKSEWHELDAIETISMELRELGSTRCIVNKVMKLQTSEVEKDEEITNAWQNIRNKSHIGSQYDWLARFAKRRKGIELGITKNGRIQDFIKQYGALKKISSDITGSYYILDISRSEADLIKVFGNFHFPLLNKTKIEMKWEAEELGYSDIMHKTWFCHSPLYNQPCGVCKTCCFAVQEGFGYRLSLFAHLRHNLKKLKEIARLHQLKAWTYHTMDKLGLVML